jgi:hypothetical protein
VYQPKRVRAEEGVTPYQREVAFPKRYIAARPSVTTVEKTRATRSHWRLSAAVLLIVRMEKIALGANFRITIPR